MPPYNYDRRTPTAAKQNPDITALNRRLVGLKPKFQGFLSHLFGGRWDTRGYQDRLSETIHLIFRPERQEGQGPGWEVELEFRLAQYIGHEPNGLYNVWTMLKDKSGRTRASHRTEKATINDLTPERLLGPIHAEGNAAMQGSTEKEMAQLHKATEEARELIVTVRFAIDQIETALRGATSPLPIGSVLMEAAGDLAEAGRGIGYTGDEIRRIIEAVRKSQLSRVVPLRGRGLPIAPSFLLWGPSVNPAGRRTPAGRDEKALVRVPFVARVEPRRALGRSTPAIRPTPEGRREIHGILVAKSDRSGH